MNTDFTRMIASLSQECGSTFNADMWSQEAGQRLKARFPAKMRLAVRAALPRCHDGSWTSPWIRLRRVARDIW
jgi:hypothetical protein